MPKYPPLPSSSVAASFAPHTSSAARERERAARPSSPNQDQQPHGVNTIAPIHRDRGTKGRPFKPRTSRSGTSSYQLRRYAEQTLGSGSLRKVVKLPAGEDLDEWLAVNGMLYPF